MNETIATILQRRSIRAYTDQPVPQELLDEILLAGQHAPSGGNSQFCHFTVIRSREVLARLAATATQSFARMEVTPGMYKNFAGAIRRAKSGATDFFYNAPVLVLVSNLKSHANAMADSAIAIENMLVAAASLDIGSCWINQIKWLTGDRDIRTILTELGIGDEEIVCGALTLGYAKIRPTAPLARTGNRITWVD